MEKIIQLKESEYKKLQEEADLKNDEIANMAEEMYKKRGTYGIVLELNTRDDYNDKITITAYSYVKDWDNKFPISEKDKRKIVNFVNAKAISMMDKKFGRQIININYWNERVKLLNHWKNKFIGIMIFGWLAAITLVIIALIK